jgi:hypothetical protein
MLFSQDSGCDEVVFTDSTTTGDTTLSSHDSGYNEFLVGSTLVGDSQDGLDKVQHDYMCRLKRWHKLITGRCFGVLIWRSSEEIIATPVEPTL